MKKYWLTFMLAGQMVGCLAIFAICQIADFHNAWEFATLRLGVVFMIATYLSEKNDERRDKKGWA